MRYILSLIVLFSLSNEAFSQCFASPGNPVGGTANTGNLNKKTFRIMTFYNYNYSDKYFEKDKLSDYSLYEKAQYNYVAATLGYGLTKKITIEAEAGYFINKSIFYNKKLSLPNYSEHGFGLSNAVISAKYSLYKNEQRRLGYSLSLGGKIPFSTKPQVIDGVELPIDVQPSTGSYGLVAQSFLMKEYSFVGYRLFLLNRLETNTKNIQGYKYGNIYISSLIVSKHLVFPWTKDNGKWTALLQLKNKTTAKRKLNDEIVPSSGSSVYFISPQLNFTLTEKLNISIIADIPVYQYYNGIQLANSRSFTINIIKDFYKN